MSTETVLLNNTIPFPCTEGFHVMTDEERAQMNMLQPGPCVCLNNPDKHVTVSIAWKEINRFSALVLNAKDLMKQTEAHIRKPMQRFGYHMDGYLSRNFGSRKAEGFRYSYDVQGTGMYGEAYVIKEDTTIYYIYVYMRREFIEEGFAAWEEMLAAMQ